MEVEVPDAVMTGSRVKATMKLGSETYSLEASKGATISEELVSLKQKNMAVLKEFITKHNVPNDVPDELIEPSSEDDEEVPENPVVKSKKSKLT